MYVSRVNAVVNRAEFTALVCTLCRGPKDTHAQETGDVHSAATVLLGIV